jgi:WD40 repeat protein
MRWMFVAKGECSRYCYRHTNLFGGVLFSSNIPSTPSLQLNYILHLSRSAALAVSASDDCTAKLWDTRVRGEVGCLEDDYQLTAVAYANDGNVVYTGGIDNCITAWDVRQMHKSMTMKGHTGEI